jgi:ubiquinone/menaquinone biosynthesis C-methylase UbiE
MEPKPQTYWNNFMNNETYKTFENWVGKSDANSKLYFYEYIKDKNYNSILDIGCGDATIFQGLQNNNININYTGVDSCKYFVDMAKKNNINIIQSDIRKINASDSSYDIVFGRHVIEHQPELESLLNEMIRLSIKECVHIFFIKPIEGDNNYINYSSKEDLYHNTYCINNIKRLLDNNPKVDKYKFEDINHKENMLIINLK